MAHASPLPPSIKLETPSQDEALEKGFEVSLEDLPDEFVLSMKPFDNTGQPPKAPRAKKRMTPEQVEHQYKTLVGLPRHIRRGFE